MFLSSSVGVPENLHIFHIKIIYFLIFPWYLHHVLSAFKLNSIGKVLKHDLERI